MAKLDRETFVLDLTVPLDVAPVIEGFALRRMGPESLEVDIPKGLELNALFNHLSAAGIHVKSLRNKSNRLEELFVSLVEAGKAA